MRSWAALLTAACLLLGGCAIRPVQYAGTPALRCTAPEFAYRLAIDPEAGTRQPDGAAETLRPTDAQALDAALERAYKSGNLHPYAPREEAVSNSLLLLSGGSEDGAFGAGFLSQWGKLRTVNADLQPPPAGQPRKTGLPRFRVVTGISTGALQASFAFIDDPEALVQSYSIVRERELLRPLVSRGLDDHPVRGAISLARRGTLATLDPLRGLLDRLLTAPYHGPLGDYPTRIHAIAREASDNEGNRSLLVGAVEMDSGDLVVFDLGAYARAWVAADTLEDRPRADALKHCYIEALIASSSVPIAAAPVFIDGKMFIDGGARFGVFLRPLDKVFAANRRTDARGEARDHLFMLINGTLQVGPQCTLAPCPNPNPRWRFDSLAFRSLSVLINQSYVASVYWSRSEGARNGLNPEIARMQPGPQGYLAHRATVALPGETPREATCGEWQAEDKRRDHPLEFHARYMRCLIDYGRNHPAVTQWARLE
ncbi:patatin-like phospholipase family protein [Novosphingobium flavum]|uniref:Patatin-like phospholipase family protein n=1 Tax=Novosphingobium aerophilum TaxID=2839843 RepID=A0A7X1KCP7_9SPHN|nr:patatin-like phospholipase family protein [Novosphingobium aerophilum]MBC2662609.1 patatin-like phospholipase family protein [Novosphingobium aerophilum]